MPSIILKVVVLVLVPFVSAFGASDQYRDINILASDENGIAFTVAISDPLEYFSYNPDDSTASIVKTVLIGLPPGTRPYLDRTSASDVMPPVRSFAGRRVLSSDRLAEMVGVQVVRGRHIARIDIYPYYRGDAYRRINIAVMFTATGSRMVSEEYFGPDPLFEPIYRHAVLNYEQFRRWPARRPVSALAKPAQHPFEVTPTWYKIHTDKKGLIKVTGQQLAAAGVPLVGLRSDSLHLFYGGGLPLEVMNDRERPSLEEMAIMVFDGGDDAFGLTDYFMFIGEKVDRWRYPADSAPVYVNNPYTSLNCYWLGISGDFGSGGRRIDAAAAVGPVDTTISQAWFDVRYEKDVMLYRDNSNREVDWYNWYWTSQSPFTFYGATSNAVPDSTAEVRLRVKTGNFRQLLVNNYVATPTYSGYWDHKFSTSRLNSGLNVFNMTVDSAFDAAPHFDYCELTYKGYLVPRDSMLDFAVRGVSGLAEFVVDDKFGEMPDIFDLTDPLTPRLIEGGTISSGLISFRAQLQSSGNRFFATIPSRSHQPVDIQQVTIRDLRQSIVPIEMLVVAYDAFVPYLDDYVQYREAASDVSISLVSIGEIMDEFSYGLYDPTAIRDFLKHAYENYPSPGPAAVLLVGDGIYDFESRLGTPIKNYVPPYIMLYDSLASDDNYVYFGQFGILDSDPLQFQGVDMVVGRWPVRSVSELNTIVGKIKTYESSTNYDAWRATVTLVADDEIGTYQTESFHVTQTEALEKGYLPSPYFRNKIYLWDYVKDSNGDKPDVNRAIIKSFNEGTLVVNYAGHGNPNTWAHEHVFNRASDLPQLRNADKLTLVFTASCSIAFFDDPTREGMAEELLRLPSGGAISTVAATRVVYAWENREFNQDVYQHLFSSDDLSICQAMYLAKLERQPERNDRAYIYFGDPLLKLGTPQYEIGFTDYPDSLTALQRHDVAGEVIEQNSGAHVDFNGTVEITVYDSEMLKSYQVGANDIEYAISGPRIYRGSAEVADGYFDFSFIAPLDIGYGGTGARISAYAKAPSGDALGLADSIVVDTTISATADQTGPTIAYSFAGRENFISGDYITPGETLILVVSDSSGINLTGGAGHAIILVIDNQVENTVNLTDLFEYTAGSFTSGQIQYDVAELSPGRHVFKIKAWDNANNSSTAEFDAEITESAQLMITDLLNYPNPMYGKTTFALYLSNSASKISLEIFTLSGRKIKHYDENSVPAGYHELYVWDGCDDDLDRVATGTYVYKASAISEHTGSVVEAFGKVVVIN
ncbi:MAG: type IX secretion system sortase PorU [Candidatus Zixiibacteriota bacterium]|nr:MAG: type IX secretion system sortase PorU [candidate division Zixibacteria bacterium]